MKNPILSNHNFKTIPLQQAKIRYRFWITLGNLGAQMFFIYNIYDKKDIFLLLFCIFAFTVVFHTFCRITIAIYRNIAVKYDDEGFWYYPISLSFKQKILFKDIQALVIPIEPNNDIVSVRLPKNDYYLNFKDTGFITWIIQKIKKSDTIILYIDMGIIFEQGTDFTNIIDTELVSFTDILKSKTPHLHTNDTEISN